MYPDKTSCDSCDSCDSSDSSDSCDSCEMFLCDDSHAESSFLFFHLCLSISFLLYILHASNTKYRCSIDPYIFANFETDDGGKSLSAKFRAFKFPESNYVLFVGTVNVCLKSCQAVQCGEGQVGYGRRRRSIHREMPFDANKIFEAELTAVVRVGYNHNNLQKEKYSPSYSRMTILSNTARSSHQSSPSSPSAVTSACLCLSLLSSLLSQSSFLRNRFVNLERNLCRFIC